jgi:hypothetical protein
MGVAVEPQFPKHNNLYQPGAYTMKREIVPIAPIESNAMDSAPNVLDSTWRRVIQRRKFLQGVGLAGASASTNRLFADGGSRLSRGDVALLRIAATIELIEADLWQQYNELGGAVDAHDNPNPGNPAYVAALQNLDGDMPQYISDNTDDEISHAAFINAYLSSKGEQQVNLDEFRTLPSTKATGADQSRKRLTNLQTLNVDTSWYFRYRSTQNPDLGAQFPQLLNITNQPAIPLNDTETPPGTPISSFQPPISDPTALRMQAIANTAGFHFSFIEQGGSSLYPVLALKATSQEVLRILLSIGGVEIDHFSLWHDKCGNAVAQPLAGPNGLTDPISKLTFPDFNNPANQHNTELSSADRSAKDQMFETNLILPEPCTFISSSLPPVSIMRPTLTANGGAVATIQSFAAGNLFAGQSREFLQKVMLLAKAADAVERGE